MGDIMEKEMDDNLDLLDLDDDGAIDALPAAPFASPRPKKPWLLLGIGALILVLGIVIIVRFIGSDSGSSIEIDLDAPTVTIDGAAPVPVPTAPAPVAPAPQPAPRESRPQPVAVAPVQPAQPQPAPKPVAQPAPQPAAPMYGTPGVPTRVIEDRQHVTFNPDAGARPAAKPAVKTAPHKAAAKSATKQSPKKPQNATRGSWYVQFGSYSTRVLAEGAEKKIRAAHPGLFSGKQFVILAAQLPNGTTTYRLRIAFATSGDANGFCRNAKSDGLDCYVAK